RPRRRLRDARVLRTIANIDADHHWTAAEGATKWRTLGNNVSQGLLRPLSRRVRAQLRAFTRALRRTSPGGADPADHRPDPRRDRAQPRGRDVHVCRARFLPGD